MGEWLDGRVGGRLQVEPGALLAALHCMIPPTFCQVLAMMRWQRPAAFFLSCEADPPVPACLPACLPAACVPVFLAGISGSRCVLC